MDVGDGQDGCSNKMNGNGITNTQGQRWRRRVSSWDDWNEMFRPMDDGLIGLMMEQQQQQQRQPERMEERTGTDENAGDLANPFTPQAILGQIRKIQQEKKMKPRTMEEVDDGTVDGDTYFDQTELDSAVDEEDLKRVPLDVTNVSLSGLYQDLEISLEQLWTGGVMMPIPSPEHLRNLSKSIYKVNLENHQMLANLRHSLVTSDPKFHLSTEQSDARIKIAGNVAFEFQRNMELLVSMIGLFAKHDRKQGAEILDVCVNVLFHPVSTPESKSLEFLAHLIHAYSVRFIKITVLWDGLLAFGRRSDCQIPLKTLDKVEQVESIFAMVKSIIPDSMVRICQLLGASQEIIPIPVSRFLFEGWLVPYFLHMGRRDIASSLSRIGDALDEKKNMVSQIDDEALLINIHQWIGTLMERDVPSPFTSPIASLCRLVLCNTSEIEILFQMARGFNSEVFSAGDHLREDGEMLRKITEEIDQLEPLHEENGCWHVIRIWSQQNESGGPSLMKWVCNRAGSLSNLLDRTQEALARETLLKHETAAQTVRYREMLGLCEEMSRFQGECTMLASFEMRTLELLEMLREIQMELIPEGTDTDNGKKAKKRSKKRNKKKRTKSNNDGDADVQNMRSTAAIQKQNVQALQKAIAHMQEPSEMLEKIILKLGSTRSLLSPAKLCFYSLSSDKKFILVNYEDDEGNQLAIPLETITEAELGLSNLDDHDPKGVRAEKSLGCCFYFKCEDEKIYQLVARDEETALMWVFGIQNLGTNCKFDLQSGAYIWQAAEMRKNRRNSMSNK